MVRRVRAPKRLSPGGSAKIENAMREVRKARRRRNVDVGITAVGVAAGMSGALFGVALLKSATIKSALLSLSSRAALIGGVSAGVGASRIFEGRVRRATKLVGKSLYEEWASANGERKEEMKRFFGKYRYVVIDWRGQVKGTNRRRFLGIGRIRLETRKILLGSY